MCDKSVLCGVRSGASVQHGRGASPARERLQLPHAHLGGTERINSACICVGVHPPMGRVQQGTPRVHIGGWGGCVW